MASVKVFGLPASTEVARVLTCLFEKDVEFQLIRMDTYKGEGYRVPEFIKLQEPTGQVTYKEGDKKTLLESRDICRHVCEKFFDQGNQLLGSGGLERASVEMWMQSEAQKFDPPSSDMIFHLAFAPLLCIPFDRNAVMESEKKLARVLDAYEEKLSESRYLAGDEFTLADLSHLPSSHYLVNKTARGYDLFARRKNVSRWWEAISNRPSWKMVANLQKEHPGALEN